MSQKEYSVFFFVCPLLIIGACSDAANSHTVRGALAVGADAIEAHDAARLFGVMDERSRFAMAAIVTARLAARGLIEAEYPEPERSRSLRALGESSHVATPEQLFLQRCDAVCWQAFSDAVGAPASEQASGDEVVVKTVRGATLHMHAGHDGRYGIVWNTQALSDERAQASRELRQIKENAAVYRRRRELER